MCRVRSHANLRTAMLENDCAFRILCRDMLYYTEARKYGCGKPGRMVAKEVLGLV